MSPKTPIVVLAGPTASGKTALALELARELDAEIVGADSVQVYRGLDVGSAKPTADELGGIVHHLLDVLDPDAAIDAMGFASLADRAIESASARDKAVLVVGGTGLWIRALVRGLVDLPPVDAEVRARIEAEVEREGPAASHARLASVDPVAAAAIHPNDALRIVRALEVHAQTGRALGDLRSAHSLGAPRRPTLFLVLDPSLETLTPRIDARVDAMLAGGWLDEVRALRERYGDAVRPLASVGYRECMAHLRGEMGFEEMVLAIRRSTRTYARRQRNWFRAEPGVDVRVASPSDVDPALRARIAAHLGRVR